MTEFKSYFKRHFKEKLPFIFYTSVASFLLSLVAALSREPIPSYVSSSIWPYAYRYEASLWTSSLILCFFSIIIPVLEFSCFKKRRNLDLFYSLPISRRSLGTVHYLTGFISLLIPFTVSFGVNLFVPLIRGLSAPGKWLYRFEYMPQYFFMCILFGFIMYSFFAFIFNEANTILDGCVFLQIYTCILTVVCLVPNTYSDTLIAREMANYSIDGIVWVNVIEFTDNFQDLMTGNTVTLLYSNDIKSLVVWIWAAIGVLSTLGLILRFGKTRTEKTGEVSDSWFGYKVLIPVLASALFALRLGVVFWIIIEIAAFALYTLYRRGFKYKKSDLITLGIFVVFLFLQS